MKKVGVLALQGDYEAHQRALLRAGALPDSIKEIRTAAELAAVDGLVIPGGESTTMLRLLNRESLFEPLRQFGQTKPIFGTCAGAILLASTVTSPEQESLHLMDISVQRNAYGRQLDSRVVQLGEGGDGNIDKAILAEGGNLEAVFIRAPIIRGVGPSVKVLATYQGTPVLAEQGLHLGRHLPPRTHQRPSRARLLFREDRRVRKLRVLFICIGNACRSQMAEGLAKHYGKDFLEVYSAGLMPIASVPSLTRKVMLEKQIPIDDQFPKGVEVFTRQPFDVVINMSGDFLPRPFNQMAEEWKVMDPYGSSEGAYRQVRDDLDKRIVKLMARLRTQFEQQPK